MSAMPIEFEPDFKWDISTQTMKFNARMAEGEIHGPDQRLLYLLQTSRMEEPVAFLGLRQKASMS